uniref:ArfGAP with SH3 domain, ankyrin repeat and PH domain 1 n=1 Tax=Latimeria chalumnae TaxID=7897 RepID=H2ZTH2_LATCH
SNRQPAKLNLLTCQVKPSPEERKCFDLISHNRTYHFQAEDEQECLIWISVLTNSKEEALNMAFRGEQSAGENSLEDLTKAIIDDVQRTPGNEICCDCGATGVNWLSHSCGIASCFSAMLVRALQLMRSTHANETTLLNLGKRSIHLAKNVGNNSFNEIMEGNLPSPSPKPTPSSDMTARKEFITAKYVDHRFAKKTCVSAAAKLNELLEAVKSRDLLALIQVYAEGVELMEPVPEPGPSIHEIFLHTSVCPLNFIYLIHFTHFTVSALGSLVAPTVCKILKTINRVCSLGGKESQHSLLCKDNPPDRILNQSGETALDTARRLKSSQMEELLVQAMSGKINPHVHVEYEWNLRQEEMDESDDDLEDKPSPIKKERSPRPQSFCHSSSISPQDKLSLPGFSTPRDKQRLSYGAFNNQIYGLPSTDSPTSPIIDAPPLPPRNPGKAPPGPPSTLPVGTQPPSGSSTLSKKRPPPPPPGHKRTLSDPPSPLPQGSQNKGPVSWGNESGLSSANRTGNKFEGLPQQTRVSTGSTKSTLGPRVLPKLPQKVALRKIDTIHHPSVDKPSHQPELFQKSPQAGDLPQKPQLGEPPQKPQAGDLPQKPQIGDLPPKPGELPPKPQLGDLPPKPQLGDLPPKPQMKDLPPRPQLGEAAPKLQTGEVMQKQQPMEINQKLQPAEVSPSVQPVDGTQKQSSEDTNGASPTLPEMPVPLPRKINSGKNKVRRVKTIYDCQADNDDELTFVEGEVIIVTGEEDQEWWIGHIEGQPERKGVFPVSFVHILSD